MTMVRLPIEYTASQRRALKMNQRPKISTAARWERIIGYSRAIRVGGQVWVAGTTSVDVNGAVHAPGDAYAQAIRCLEIIESALNQLGTELAGVVRTRIYVVDIADWEAVARAHGEVFREIRPASTLVETGALVEPELLVEIEAEAVLSSH